ncbi:hypothetical protein QVD17_35060 [Tagetes erecta]|uniref:Uncharacterized protein n=1 Tax=Tagetes erecta TaxID=13708 RepID=A0AAD8K0P6_TARER|nr:hypothetical protein QVD17_35060 [Tagetes erecta]
MHILLTEIVSEKKRLIKFVINPNLVSRHSLLGFDFSWFDSAPPPIHYTHLQSSQLLMNLVQGVFFHRPR